MAEVLRAIHVLRPGNPTTTEAILGLLGMGAGEEIQALDEAASPSTIQPHPESVAPKTPEPSQKPEEMRSGSRRPLVHRVDRPKRRRPRPSVTTLARPDAYTTREPEPLAPLFQPGWFREIAIRVASTRAAVGAPDVERLLALMERGKPVTEIPRAVVPTLLRGAQLLVDIGIGMLPYAEDQRGFIGDLRRVIGPDLVEVLYFRDFPRDRAGRGSIRTWKEYERPRADTPVLVLSELGLAGPVVCPGRATLQQLLEFFRQLRVEGYPVIVLTPYPPAKYPSTIRREVSMLPWDRTTTPSLATAVGRAAERLSE